MTAPCARNATNEISRNCPIRRALTFRCRHQRLYLSQTQNYQRMHISFEYALRWARKVCSVFQNYKRNNYVMTKCSIIPVLPKRTSSIIWNAIVVQQVMNYTLSSLHFEKCEIVRNTISFHINLFPCYASHRLKQVRCLALEVIIFCLTIVCVWEGLGRGGVLQQ